MVELEKTAFFSVVYTPKQECGTVTACDYCWRDRRDFKTVIKLDFKNWEGQLEKQHYVLI